MKKGENKRIKEIKSKVLNKKMKKIDKSKIRISWIWKKRENSEMKY